MSNEMITTLEDTSLVAFLSLQGHKVVPLRSKAPVPEEAQPRIVFDIYGDIEADVKAYQSNAMVGIADFVRHLKQVRSSMFTLKKLNTKREVII